jgi:acyl-CoA synthetase (AMP-forming)/AMP-acid ligase II
MGLLLGDILRRNATYHPGKTAYVMRAPGERVAVTYGEFDQRANRLANAFGALGIARGARVAILMRNNVHYPIVYFAILKLGAVAVPLNFRYRTQELREVLDQARPVLVVVEEPYEQLARESLASESTRIVTSGRASEPETLSLEALMRGAPERRPDTSLRETDPFALLYTSGTTGASKGVIQTHRAYHLQTGQPVFSACGTGEEDVGLCMYPLFHSSGWRTSLIYWRARATVVIVQRADPTELLHTIQEEGVTQFMGLPETLRKMCEVQEQQPYDLASMRELNTGTSTITPDDVRRFCACFGVEGLRVHYGSSECGPVSSLSAEQSHERPTSIGRVAPHVDVRLIGEHGDPVAVGEIGEIWVHSEFLMEGYDGAEQETARVLQDGWYRTGDLARFDAEGYLYIEGRVKEVIRSAGESIFPAEVEAAICQLHGVTECAVIGVPDEEWGEVPLAVIVAHGGEPLAPEVVVAHCRHSLAAYKCPRHVRFLRSLPKTSATGKVRKAELRDRFLAGTL